MPNMIINESASWVSTIPTPNRRGASGRASGFYEYTIIWH